MVILESMAVKTASNMQQKSRLPQFSTKTYFDILFTEYKRFTTEDSSTTSTATTGSVEMSLVTAFRASTLIRPPRGRVAVQRACSKVFNGVRFEFRPFRSLIIKHLRKR